MPRQAQAFCWSGRVKPNSIVHITKISDACENWQSGYVRQVTIFACLAFSSPILVLAMGSSVLLLLVVLLFADVQAAPRTCSELVLHGHDLAYKLDDAPCAARMLIREMGAGACAV